MDNKLRSILVRQGLSPDEIKTVGDLSKHAVEEAVLTCQRIVESAPEHLLPYVSMTAVAELHAAATYTFNEVKGQLEKIVKQGRR